MAFLRKTGKFRKIPFAIVYSGLQKGLRGNLLTLAIEMAREFEDYPNALKLRLIQNVAEDCCDWELIMRIMNTPTDFNQLIQFIPEICAHIKCRDATFGFRVAVEFPDAISPKNGKIIMPNMNDSLLELLIKEKTAAKQNKLDAFGKFMEQLIFKKYNIQIDFHKVYAYSKNRSIVDSTIAYFKREYTHTRPEHIEELTFNNGQLTIPDFVFDKHTGNYAKNKNYDYFLNNMIIEPRKEMTYLEKLARVLYIKVNKRTRDLLVLNPTTEPTFINKKTELPFNGDGEDILKSIQNSNDQPELLQRIQGIQNQPQQNQSQQNQSQILQNISSINLNQIEHLQTQLITARSKPKTFYTSITSKFSHIIKFPINTDEINNLITSDKIKELFGLIPSNIKQIQIISDNTAYTGVIMTNFNQQINSNDVIIKSSKLENNVIIYNGNHLHLEWNDLNNLTHDEQINYLKILAFRYIIGTNDTNNRNILKVDDKIISIDDPMLLISPKMIYKSPIPIKHKQIFNMILNSNFQEIQRWLMEIKSKINIEFCKQQIDKLMNINNWIF